MAKRYTQKRKVELIEKVLLLLPNNSINKACEQAGVSPSTLGDWVAKDDNKSEQYARARSLYVDKLAEEVLTISDEDIPLAPDGKTDNALVQRNRLRVDSRKWYAGKLKPKKYGDKVALVGDETQPIAVKIIKRVIVKPQEDDDE